MNQLAPIRDPGAVMESVIVKGDLAKLTPQERADYYAAVCRSIGLNPLTQPFSYMTLNGKMVLYAGRGATDQLRAIHNVSVVEMSETERGDVCIVTCKVQNGAGRTDVSKGAVTIGNLKGDALANAIMKAETKAKRRATLSICGLGMLDESEVETIPAGARRPVAAPVEIAAPAAAIEHDPDTGETGPRVLPVPTAGNVAGNTLNWVGFGQAFIAGIQSAQTVAELDEWSSLNTDRLGEMSKAAPRAYGSVVKALAVMAEKLEPPATDSAGTPRLPPKESQQLRRALVRKLADCSKLADVDAWRAASDEGIASMQDEDRAGVLEWEATRREQLAEVAEVVG
jgi:hypothetical protein